MPEPATSLNPPSPELRELLKWRFERIVVFSGAGISAEGGIPTFRSGHNGLWSEFNPSDLATPSAWKANKALVWGWYEWRRGIVQNAQPNAGHRAAAALQEEFGATVITQNVDDLHERAGAADVLHLHGSLFAPRCFACAAPHTLTHAPSAKAARELSPPRCSSCTGYVRPGVVWFGESLPEGVLANAKNLIGQCDLLLVVGTSGLVQPAAGLIALAPAHTRVVEINPEATPNTDGVTLSMCCPAGVGLPQVLAALR